MVEGGVTSYTRDSVSYYREVADLIVSSFVGIPIVWGSYPDSDGKIVWHGRLRSTDYVSPTIDVETTDGAVHPFFRLERPFVKWISEHFPNVEFHSWTPIAKDPRYVRYARLLLVSAATEPHAHARSIKNAALKLRELLDEYETASIPVLGGRGGVTLFIPFSDAPEYPEVRAWLHYLANDAAARFPRTFTTEANATGDGRIHLHVGSNGPGRFRSGWKP
jgi:DNA primase